MESPQSMLGDLPADSDELGPYPVAIDQEPSPSGKTSYFAMPNLRRANTVAQEGNTRKSKAARDRSATSLLRAKGSHGMLQQTPLKRSRTHHPVPGPREPKHFTVGNVGQNGKIFLRPIRNLSPKGLFSPPFSSSSNQSRFERPQQPVHAQFETDPSRWSNSQLSELRPGFMPEDTCDDGVSFTAESAARLEFPYHLRHRPHSFSTISEHQSVTNTTPPGEFRIVIDRSEDRPKSADGSSHPALEVPIPHYRLGTPQFNVEGSAAIHSSIYTRTSVSDNPRVSSFLRDTPSPNVYISDSLRPGRPSFATSMFSGAAAIDLGRGSAATGNSIVYELKEPVEPAIFETLGTDMDDQSVVRYIPGTKDISAATPARIVAEISSESFMDYELVSDFFLTFRSYLSTCNLLSLLLARLQWAINRLEDDGRIIRIRTFAALRHWILNYFVDDFVADYDLRCRFCETINALYDDVRSRDGGGMSDLKILIDLKRCWQGKCSLYWKSMDLVSVYHCPRTPIVPGGVSVERPDSIDDRPENSVPTDLPASASHPAPAANNYHHDRNDSAATAKTAPAAPPSDQSVQPTSCSLLPKSSKHISMPFPYPNAPRPVPLKPAHPVPPQDPKPVSPIIAKHHHMHGHTHKRSGSFSDSVRDDRAPLSQLQTDHQGNLSGHERLNPGSLIRGGLFSPAESCMTMMAPPSPPLPSSSSSSFDFQGSSDGTSKPGTAHSGVKTFIGSIRKVLHSRNGTQSGPSRMPGLSGPSLRGKTSAVPNNVAFGSDLYRDRKLAAVTKKPLRIDALCDMVLEQYRQRTGHADASTGQMANPPRLEPPVGEGEPDSDVNTAIRQSSEQRAKSQITGGSESIVIVDDTGLGIPIMSGAAGEEQAGLDQPPSFLNVDPLSTPKTASLRAPSERSRELDEYSLPIYYDNTSLRSDRPSNSLHILDTTTRRSRSGNRSTASRMRRSLSHGLRKYASFQSGISRQRASMGSGTLPPLPDLKDPQFNYEKPAGPILRRRPGGDLRRMRNGDFEPQLEMGYFSSDQSYRSSMPESLISRPQTRETRRETSLIPPNPHLSVDRPHSPHNARRSFEAAIAQFAQIPDQDDGGVESALLKLEGKWEGPAADDDENTPGVEEGECTSGAASQRIEQKWRHHHQHIFKRSSAASDRSHQTVLGENLAYSQIRGRLAPPRPYSDSIAESEESYNSIPLLERGLTDESMKKPQISRVISTPAVPHSRLSDISSRGTSGFESSHPSFDVVKETESLRGIPRGSTLPVPTPKASRQMADRFSGLSSEMSVDLIDRREAMEVQSLDTNSLDESSFGIPPHPLAHPPSPPMTIPNHRSLIACTTPRSPVAFQAQPLTPDPSPRHKQERSHIRSIDMRTVSNDILSRSETGRHNQGLDTDPGYDHVPFVLSCESKVLAEQMTLVEMAALSEVDWRDLVDMRLSTSSPSTLSWVQFLFEEERRGIDLVVGRFNLMAKWVLSEIVLTQDMHDRARTITKFIHTAAHSKRINNYATMVQIIIALSSTDCTKLERTWALVPQEEQCLFKDMESLIQPVRNFHGLRVEMETANLQEGCIPFVGLYVHDLTYNSQKPAQIMNRDGDPLVNFERYRTTARIVKNLLRLIDLSTKYHIEPVQGIIERCLWIASLSEEQIQARSKQLH